MFLIVLHHSAYHGYWKNQVSPWVLGILFTALTFWHVDCFIAISGWFGIKFSWKKFLNLWGLIVFYSGVSLAVSLFMGWKVSMGSIVSAGWFGGCYLMLMLMAPLLNAAIDYLYSLGKSALIKAWALMMFGVVMNWLPLHGLSGLSFQGSYSVMLMIVVYVTANVMRKLDLNISKLQCVCIAVACLFGILITSCVPALLLAHLGKQIRMGTFIWFTNYNAPHIMLMALIVLYFFAEYVKVSAWLSRIIIFCSPSMFGVYLLHEVTSFGRKIYTMPEQWLANATDLNPCVIVLISASITFVLCLCVDLLRRIAVRTIRAFV